MACTGDRGLAGSRAAAVAAPSQTQLLVSPLVQQATHQGSLAAERRACGEASTSSPSTPWVRRGTRRQARALVAAHAASSSSPSLMRPPMSAWPARPRFQRPTNLSAPVITTLIKRCGSIEELQGVVNTHSTAFNHIHVSAALLHALALADPAASAAGPAPGVVGRPAASASPAGEEAAGSTTDRPADSALQGTGRAGATQAAGASGSGSSTGGSGSGSTSSDASSADAMSILPLAAPSIGSSGSGNASVSSQGSERSPTTPQAHLPRDSIAAGLLSQLFAMVPSKLDQFDVQGVANTLYAMAKTGNRDPALLASLLAAVQYRMDMGVPQNVANILWSCVTLGAAPDRDWMARYYMAIDTAVSRFNPQDVSNTLWAFARLEVEAQESAALAAQQQAASLAAAQALAAGSAGSSPGPGTGSACTAAGPSAGLALSALSAAGSGTVGASGSPDPSLAQLLNDGSGGNHEHSDAAPQPSSQTSAANIATNATAASSAPSSPAPSSSGGRMHKVPTAIIGKILLASYPLLPQFSAQQLANTVWSLARLRFLPVQAWSYQFVAASTVKLRAGEFSAGELVGLAWGMSRLRLVPSAAWAEAFLAASYRRLPSFSADELAQILLATGALRIQPPLGWLRAFVAAATSRLAEFGPRALTSALVGIARLARSCGLVARRPRSAGSSSSSSTVSSSGNDSSSGNGNSSSNRSGSTGASNGTGVDGVSSAATSASQLTVNGAHPSNGNGASGSDANGNGNGSSGNGGATGVNGSAAVAGGTVLAGAVAAVAASGGAANPVGQPSPLRLQPLTQPQAQTPGPTPGAAPLVPGVVPVGRTGQYSSISGPLQQDAQQLAYTLQAWLRVAEAGFSTDACQQPDCEVCRTAGTAAEASQRQQQQQGGRRGGVQVLNAQELCNVLYAVAALGLSPSPRWMHGMLTSLQLRMGAVAAVPRQAAMVAWALRTLRVTPPPQWQAQFAAATAPKRLRAVGALELASLLAAFAAWRTMPPGTWMARFWWRSAALLCARRVPPRRLAHLLAAMAAHRLRPHQLWCSIATGAMAAAMAAQVSGVAVGFSAHLLSSSTRSLAQLGVVPDRRWIRAFLSASGSCWSSFQPAHWSELMWALTRMQVFIPLEWLDRFSATTAPQLHAFSGQQLATVLWSLRKRNYQPPGEWLAAFYAASGPALKGMTDAQLVNTLWHLNYMSGSAAASWQLQSTQPSREWVAALTGTAAARHARMEPRLRDLLEQGLEQLLQQRRKTTQRRRRQAKLQRSATTTPKTPAATSVAGEVSVAEPPSQQQGQPSQASQSDQGPTLHTSDLPGMSGLHDTSSRAHASRGAAEAPASLPHTMGPPTRQHASDSAPGSSGVGSEGAAVKEDGGGAAVKHMANGQAAKHGAAPDNARDLAAAAAAVAAITNVQEVVVVK